MRNWTCEGGNKIAANNTHLWVDWYGLSWVEIVWSSWLYLPRFDETNCTSHLIVENVEWLEVLSEERANIPLPVIERPIIRLTFPGNQVVSQHILRLLHTFAIKADFMLNQHISKLSCNADIYALSPCFTLRSKSCSTNFYNALLYKSSVPVLLAVPFVKRCQLPPQGLPKLSEQRIFWRLLQYVTVDMSTWYAETLGSKCVWTCLTGSCASYSWCTYYIYIYICIICIYIILIIYNTLYTCSICIRILLGIVPSAEHLGQSLSWDFAHDLSDAELRGATQLEICRTRFLPRGDQVVSLGSIRWVATLATTHQFSEHMWIWWGFDTLIYILIYIDIHCHIVNFEESDLMTMIMAPSFTKAVQGIHRNLHAAHWNRPPRGRRVSREMQWFDLRLQDGAPQWCLLVYNPH